MWITGPDVGHSACYPTEHTWTKAREDYEVCEDCGALRIPPSKRNADHDELGPTVRKFNAETCQMVQYGATITN